MSADGRIMRRIRTALLAADGQRHAELAERLGETVADVRTAVWALYRRRQVDMCIGYVVLPPHPAERVHAA